MNKAFILFLLGALSLQLSAQSLPLKAVAAAGTTTTNGVYAIVYAGGDGCPSQHSKWHPPQ